MNLVSIIVPGYYVLDRIWCPLSHCSLFSTLLFPSYQVSLQACMYDPMWHIIVEKSILQPGIGQNWSKLVKIGQAGIMVGHPL